MASNNEIKGEVVGVVRIGWILLSKEKANEVLKKMKKGGINEGKGNHK